MGEVATGFEYGLNAKATKYDGVNKYLRITDIDDSTRLFSQSDLTSPEKISDIDAKYLLDNGDILFARTGASVGKSYRYDINDGKVYFAGFLIRISINSKNDTEFIFQKTLTAEYNNFVKVTSMRSGQPGINAREYSKFQFQVPKLKEQRKIGAFFKYLDKTINLHQRKLNKLKDLKKSYLERLLPQNNKMYPQVRFEGYCENWTSNKLANLLRERNDKSIPTEEYPLMAFVQNKGVVQKGDRFDRSFLVKDEKKKYKKTKLGDFIYSSNNLETGSIGFNTTGNAVISPVYSIFSSKSESASEYIGILSQRKDFINKMIRYRQGVVYGQWRIHEKDFLSIEICNPSSSEQKKIVNFIGYLDKTINVVENKINLLTKLKKVYLSKLFV